jgi:hypothetical protein
VIFLIERKAIARGKEIKYLKQHVKEVAQSRDYWKKECITGRDLLSQNWKLEAKSFFQPTMKK